MAQKKEAAEQLYENPYGRKFTSNEIRDILDREEKVRVLNSYWTFNTICGIEFSFQI